MKEESRGKRFLRYGVYLIGGCLAYEGLGALLSEWILGWEAFGFLNKALPYLLLLLMGLFLCGRANDRVPRGWYYLGWKSCLVYVLLIIAVVVLEEFGQTEIARKTGIAVAAVAVLAYFLLFVFDIDLVVSPMVVKIRRKLHWYDSKWREHDGWSRVRFGSYCYDYVDSSGAYINGSGTYWDAWDFVGGTAMVKTGKGQMNMIDTKGKLLVPDYLTKGSTYVSISEYKGMTPLKLLQLEVVRHEHAKGKEGKDAAAPRMEDVRHRYIMRRNGSFVWVDKDNKPVGDLSIFYNHYYGVYYFYAYKDNYRLRCRYYYEYKFVTPFYECFKEINERLARIKVGGKWGVVDVSTGKYVVPTAYDKIAVSRWNLKLTDGSAVTTVDYRGLVDASTAVRQSVKKSYRWREATVKKEIEFPSDGWLTVEQNKYFPSICYVSSPHVAPSSLVGGNPCVSGWQKKEEKEEKKPPHLAIAMYMSSQIRSMIRYILPRYLMDSEGYIVEEEQFVNDVLRFWKSEEGKKMREENFSNISNIEGFLPDIHQVIYKYIYEQLDGSPIRLTTDNKDCVKGWLIPVIDKAGKIYITPVGGKTDLLIEYGRAGKRSLIIISVKPSKKAWSIEQFHGYNSFKNGYVEQLNCYSKIYQNDYPGGVRTFLMPVFYGVYFEDYDEYGGRRIREDSEVEADKRDDDHPFIVEGNNVRVDGEKIYASVNRLAHEGEFIVPLYRGYYGIEANGSVNGAVLIETTDCNKEPVRMRVEMPDEIKRISQEWHGRM